MTAKEYIDLEDRHGAHNYHPLPVVLSEGRGAYVFDTDGKQYFDFLSAYSAVNQGHCHPRIVSVMQAQTERLTLTSRAFHNDQLGPYEKYLTDYFQFDKVLPMNTGAEAVETAIKICRKWGYEVKGIPTDQARIIVCGQNFHGRTTTIISFSSDPNARGNFGPYTPGFEAIPYGDIEALRNQLAKDPATIAGVLVEPIQGEAGVFVPDDNYIPQVAQACRDNNVLFIADEIQTGIGRTGALLRVCGDCSCAGHCERQATYTRPDVLILGKALSGGTYP
ncbi:MAG: ornithine--oxo-acid transaminase, partial [Lewinella sp.]